MVDNDDDEDFFKKKGDTGKDIIEEVEEEDDKAMPALSKNALRKIRPEGPYQGKNKMVFDGEGAKVTPKSDFDSVYMNSIRDKDGGKMMIERDTEVKEEDDAQVTYMTTMKKRLAKNLAADDKIHKERIKEKRIKAKKRMRAEAGDDDKNDDEGVMTLGNPDGDSNSDEGSDQGAS